MDVKCTFCSKIVFTAPENLEEAKQQYFCGKECRHKHMRKGLKTWVKMKKEKSTKGVKLRKCLGWCGQEIRTTKNIRFCKSCSDRKSFASGTLLDDVHSVAINGY